MTADGTFVTCATWAVVSWDVICFKNKLLQNIHNYGTPRFRGICIVSCLRLYLAGAVAAYEYSIPHQRQHYNFLPGTYQYLLRDSTSASTRIAFPDLPRTLRLLAIPNTPICPGAEMLQTTYSTLNLRFSELRKCCCCCRCLDIPSLKLEDGSWLALCFWFYLLGMVHYQSYTVEQASSFKSLARFRFGGHPPIVAPKRKTWVVWRL